MRSKTVATSFVALAALFAAAAPASANDCPIRVVVDPACPVAGQDNTNFVLIEEALKRKGYLVSESAPRDLELWITCGRKELSVTLAQLSVDKYVTQKVSKFPVGTGVRIAAVIRSSLPSCAEFAR
jgi:hypothetical protein